MYLYVTSIIYKTLEETDGWHRHILKRKESKRLVIKINTVEEINREN